MFASSIRGLMLKAPAFLRFRSSHSHRLLHHGSSPPPPPHPKTSLTDHHQQLVRNQTNVSTILATHLFTNKFPKSNIVFAPFTIHFILTVLAFGSRGKTLDQLLAFLKTNTTDELKFLYSQIQSLIEEDKKCPDDETQPEPELGFKNQISVDRTVSMIPPPSKQVEDATVYKALFKVDYKSEGLWIIKFDCSETKESDFNLLNGSKVQVPFITNKKKHYVCEYDGFKVLRCPYLQLRKQKCTMYLFLPNAKDGIRSLLEKISSTSDSLDNHIPDQKGEMGEFLIPKLKISFNFEASDMLKELGLVLPFNAENGLTEIIDYPDGPSIYVSSMPQKIVVEVNEGTKPVAALEYECSPKIKAKVDFVADHPFVFVIRNDVTKAVLLTGQVIDPRVG